MPSIIKMRLVAKYIIAFLKWQLLLVHPSSSLIFFLFGLYQHEQLVFSHTMKSGPEPLTCCGVDTCQKNVDQLKKRQVRIDLSDQVKLINDVAQHSRRKGYFSEVALLWLGRYNMLEVYGVFHYGPVSSINFISQDSLKNEYAIRMQINYCQHAARMETHAFFIKLL